MTKVVSLCFEVCYPQRNALSLKRSKAKTGKIRHVSHDIRHLHEIHKAKDCGILFVLLLNTTVKPYSPPNNLRHSAGTAWDIIPTDENIRRRQQQPPQAFTADVPAKLNSSQLRRLAGVKTFDGCFCRRRMLSYRNSISGSTVGYVAGSSAAYENQALRSNGPRMLTAFVREQSVTEGGMMLS